MSIFAPLYSKIPYYTPLEIKIKRSDDFLRIRETLTRIGVGSFKKKTLWQTCHIVHEKGKYYILHFLEMLIMDGQNLRISPEDIKRRNSVVKLLEQWGLCEIKSNLGTCSDQKLRIIAHKEKHEWSLLSKYHSFTAEDVLEHQDLAEK